MYNTVLPKSPYSTHDILFTFLYDILPVSLFYTWHIIHLVRCTILYCQSPLILHILFTFLYDVLPVILFYTWLIIHLAIYRIMYCPSHLILHMTYYSPCYINNKVLPKSPYSTHDILFTAAFVDLPVVRRADADASVLIAYVPQGVSF